MHGTITWVKACDMAQIKASISHNQNTYKNIHKSWVRMGKNTNFHKSWVRLELLGIKLV